MDVRLVVFDLDETLVHATQAPFAHAYSFVVPPYYVYLRPFAMELIHYCALRYDIAVWSSSSEQYVEAVTARLFGDCYPTKFSWAANRCVQKPDLRTGGYLYIKDLRKIQKHGYVVDEILMIDDSPEKLQRQPGRHIRVPPFIGDANDVALLDVVSQLERFCE